MTAMFLGQTHLAPPAYLCYGINRVIGVWAN